MTRCACLYTQSLKILASVAVAFHHKDCSIIKDSVKGAKQSVIFTEELSPLGRGLVACKYHSAGPILIVSAVYHIEEQTGIVFVKNTSSNFIYDEAGWLYESVYDC